MKKYLNGIVPAASATPQNFTYDDDNHSLNYNFTYPDGGSDNLGKDKEIYDYSVTTTEPYMGDKTWSVNGTLHIEYACAASAKDKLDDISNKTIIDQMKSWCGGTVLKESASVDRDAVNGQISFNGTFKEASVLNSEGQNKLDGLQGLSNYSLNMTVPIRQFSLAYVLGGACESLIVDLNKNTRASLSISANGTKGADGLGATDAAVEAALKAYVLQKKNKFTTSPTDEKKEPPRFTIDDKGCASYSQTFSWSTKNVANSETAPEGIIGNLKG